MNRRNELTRVAANSNASPFKYCFPWLTTFAYLSWLALVSADLHWSSNRWDLAALCSSVVSDLQYSNGTAHASPHCKKFVEQFFCSGNLLRLELIPQRKFYTDVLHFYTFIFYIICLFPSPAGKKNCQKFEVPANIFLISDICSLTPHTFTSFHQ